MALSEVQVIAANAYSVLEVDATATPWLHNMYPDLSTVLEAISYFNLEVAPGLCDLLKAPQAPSLEDMLPCTLSPGSSRTWLVYLQQFQEDSDIYHHIYCGSGINVEGGNKRVAVYNAYLDRGGQSTTIPAGIVKLISQGYKRVGATVLFRANIPGNYYDAQYLRALILLLEGAITAKFWLFEFPKLGRLSVACLWDKEDLPYRGLCSQSSLSEVVPPLVADVLIFPKVREEFDQARKERKKFTTRRYS